MTKAITVKKNKKKNINKENCKDSKQHLAKETYGVLVDLKCLNSSNNNSNTNHMAKRVFFKNLKARKSQSKNLRRFLMSFNSLSNSSSSRRYSKDFIMCQWMNLNLKTLKHQKKRKKKKMCLIKEDQCLLLNSNSNQSKSSNQ